MVATRSKRIISGRQGVTPLAWSNPTISRPQQQQKSAAARAPVRASTDRPTRSGFSVSVWRPRSGSDRQQLCRWLQPCQAHRMTEELGSLSCSARPRSSSAFQSLSRSGDEVFDAARDSLGNITSFLGIMATTDSRSRRVSLSTAMARSLVGGESEVLGIPPEGTDQVWDACKA